MSSISHVVSTATQSPLCNSRAHDQEPCEPAPELVRHFYPQAKRQIVTGDYLRRKWLPVYGPRFYSLIKALRGHCSYEIKEGEAMCYPSETTLALECGVTRRTIINWLARVEEGEEQQYPGLKVGDFCHPRHGKALQQFLRIKGKRRYDPAGQRSVKTVNDYFVRMDDPPVPEDEPKIWARAYELATLHLERQAEEAERQAKEQERDARHQRHEHQAREQEHDTHRQGVEAQASQSPEQETTDTSAASFGEEDFTHNNVKKLHAQQCENVAQNLLFSTPLTNTDKHRSMHERQPNGDDAERAMGRDKKTLVGGEPGGVSQKQHTSREGHKGTGPAPLNDKRVEKKPPTDFDRALLQAERVAGSVLYDLMCAAHAHAPIVGMRTVLIALVNAGAPPVKLLELVELGRNRVQRSLARGRRIHTTLAGYFISVMQHLATEARDKGWDTALIELEDDIEFQRARWRNGTRRAADQEQEPVPGEAQQEAPSEMDQEAPVEASTMPETPGDEEDTTPEAPATPEPEDPYEAAQREAREEAQHYANRPIDPQARQIWQSALERIRPKVSSSAFRTWFDGTQGLVFEDETLIVRVGSSFSRQHLENRFQDLIWSAVSEQRGIEAETRLIVLPDAQEDD